MDEIFNVKNFIIKLLFMIEKLKCLIFNIDSKGFLYYLKLIDNKI